MKLTEKAITAIREPAIRRKLAEALDCTDQSIMRYIKDNEDNGDLTKVVAIKVISEATELSEQEILEEDTEEVKNGLEAAR